MNTYDDRPALMIVAPEDVEEVQEKLRPQHEEEETGEDQIEYSSLATHIMKVFEDNKQLKQTNKIEQKLLQSLRAYNGHYDPEDLARIRETGGSEIYMNLTPTKCRAAMSWIRDILMSAKETSWSLEPTSVPDIPEDIKAQIEQHVNQLAEQHQPAPSPDQQQPKPTAQDAAQKMQDINQLKRDIEAAIQDEIYKVAQGEVKKFERIVADQLQEGGWEKAFSEFIEDFCVFQAAIMKAPIVTKKKRLTYVGGQVEEKEDFIFLNKRVSPFDIYPSAGATDITDGDLCEHIKLDPKALYKMIGVKGYREENIRKVLEEFKNGGSGNSISTSVESERAEEEMRGDTFRANKGLIQGVHFFGSVPHCLLKDWGFSEEEIGTDEDNYIEVEAILAGNEVIKCILNDDPLLRRPYYKASFQSIPGSWWGRSLPELMRDIQRMCNATARALANNMGIASGPQIEVYVDRLADDVEIENMKPFHVWQLTSDPTGSGGRAVQFWQPSSNANELLAVYKEFELRADDATGIPRYAYGNERTGAAAQTASGMSMLLESASKGVKDAIRNIDYGLIKPRVEHQFYLNVISDDGNSFTGDVNVVPKGSETLTLKGSSEMRRNEFLQILANPNFVQIVGMEGIADILREMAKSLGFTHNIVPSRLELRKKQEEIQRQQQQAAEAQAQEVQVKAQTSLQATQMQVQGQDAMNQRSLQLKAEEIKANIDQKEKDRNVRIIELDQARQNAIAKETSALQKQQMVEANKQLTIDKQIALSLKEGDKVNQQ